MFTDLFYYMRAKGLKVSMNEWLSLMEALERGLCRNSLLEFYYVSRAILVKTEADFDKFDEIFLDYFDRIQHIEDIPQELMDWLHEPKNMKKYDKDEVDARTTYDLEKLRQMLEERLQEQHERHDGGQYWVGTGGTSTMGHSGYAATGIRVGGKSQHRHALQVAGEREFQDFREDNVLDQRSFQLAFRRLRQMTTRQDGPMDVLNLGRTIDETCNNAGYLHLSFDRPRTNDIKVMVLFDSGGSMTPYTRLCGQLFQAVNRANNFKDLQIYYFHNCWYSELYTGPRCVYGESVPTQWIINNLSREYKVIVVGDASMAPSELTWIGGSSYYNRYNAETGLTWLNRFHTRFDKMVWFNPIPEAMWEYDYGYQTIEMIRQAVDMYPLTVEGLGRGLKKLVSAR